MLTKHSVCPRCLFSNAQKSHKGVWMGKHEAYDTGCVSAL